MYSGGWAGDHLSVEHRDIVTLLRKIPVSHFNFFKSIQKWVMKEDPFTDDEVNTTTEDVWFSTSTSADSNYYSYSFKISQTAWDRWLHPPTVRICLRFLSSSPLLLMCECWFSLQLILRILHQPDLKCHDKLVRELVLNKYKLNWIKHKEQVYGIKYTTA